VASTSLPSHKRKPRSDSKRSEGGRGWREAERLEARCAKSRGWPWFAIGDLKWSCRVVDRLSREGTLGREIFERVTVLEVEAILAAVSESRSGKHRDVARRERRDRGVRGWSPQEAKANAGLSWRTNNPTKPGDPPKRFGRRETLDSSVLVGATHRVHAGRKLWRWTGSGRVWVLVSRVLGGRHRSDASRSCALVSRKTEPSDTT